MSKEEFDKTYNNEARHQSKDSPKVPSEVKSNVSKSAYNESKHLKGASKHADALFYLDGILGNLYVYEKKVIIDKSGSTFSKVINGFAGEKTIAMKSIQSVQFKLGGKGFNGFIQFGILGGVEQQGGILSNTQDENTVFFTLEQNDVAQKVREYIEERIY